MLEFFNDLSVISIASTNIF